MRSAAGPSAKTRRPLRADLAGARSPRRRRSARSCRLLRESEARRDEDLYAVRVAQPASERMEEREAAADRPDRITVRAQLVDCEHPKDGARVEAPTLLA